MANVYTKDMEDRKKEVDEKRGKDVGKIMMEDKEEGMEERKKVGKCRRDKNERQRMKEGEE